MKSLAALGSLIP